MYVFSDNHTVKAYWYSLLNVKFLVWLLHERSDYHNVQASWVIDHHWKLAAILQDNELDETPDWIHPPQRNNLVPERSTIKCQSGCQK